MGGREEGRRGGWHYDNTRAAQRMETNPKDGWLCTPTPNLAAADDGGQREGEGGHTHFPSRSHHTDIDAADAATRIYEATSTIYRDFSYDEQV